MENLEIFSMEFGNFKYRCYGFPDYKITGAYKDQTFEVIIGISLESKIIDWCLEFSDGMTIMSGDGKYGTPPEDHLVTAIANKLFESDLYKIITLMLK